jgi:hypothetical protein
MKINGIILDRRRRRPRTGVRYLLKMASPAQRPTQLRGIQSVVVRHAEAAAVSAIASGSQHNTIISISAFSLATSIALAPMHKDRGLDPPTIDRRNVFWSAVRDREPPIWIFPKDRKRSDRKRLQQLGRTSLARTKEVLLKASLKEKEAVDGSGMKPQMFS